MKLLVRGLLALALAVGLSLNVSAEEKKEVKKEETKKPEVKKEETKKPEVKKEQPKPAVNPLFTFNKNMKPAATEEQIKKLADLEKEYTSQVKDIAKKIGTIMTPERQKAAADARKKAAADGKKGKELQEAVNAALKLSDDEKKELADIQKANGKLVGEINKKKNELLSAEQKESLKPKPKKESK